MSNEGIWGHATDLLDFRAVWMLSSPVTPQVILPSKRYPAIRAPNLGGRASVPGGLFRHDSRVASQCRRVKRGTTRGVVIVPLET